MKQFMTMATLTIVLLLLLAMLGIKYDMNQAQKIAHNETYITALQSELESLTTRVEQLEGRE